jgi:signal transduction histidine kinase
VLTEDCLLIGFIGGKFKVGRLHGVSQETPVYLRHEIIPVRVASDDITDDFLLRSIMSEPVQKQAQMMASGVSISRITKQDLLSIVINVPKSKEQQELLMKEDTRSSLTEADRKIIQSYEDFRKDMHMKKHAIGQTLFNLNNWWDALQQARIEGNGVVSDDATTGKIRKVSVASIYDSIQKAINQLQQQINKFDRGNGLAVKKFALTEFIEDYISRKQSPLFSFFYDKSMHHASKTLPEVEYNETTGEYRETGNIILNEGDPIEYVEFAPDALEIVFDNIVSNACCHGFKDRTNNVVKIELKSEGDNFVIIISNNGSAIHAQIKPEEVFVYGKTSKMGKSGDKDETHFGIGGYEVQKLMREFGGDAEFISDPESDFPVSYKLTFYNTNFESIEL